MEWLFIASDYSFNGLLKKSWLFHGNYFQKIELFLYFLKGLLNSCIVSSWEIGQTIISNLTF